MGLLCKKDLFGKGVEKWNSLQELENQNISGTNFYNLFLM